MFTVKVATTMFFDKPAVKRAVDRAARRNLSKFGAYTRQQARSSLEYRTFASSPGQPPNVHKTMKRTKTNKKGITKTQSVSPLREFVFFAYEESRKNVVIGPAKLNSKSGQALPALEYGGRARIKLGRDRGSRVFSIKARPFMRPAFERTKRELPSIWANSVR